RDRRRAGRKRPAADDAQGLRLHAGRNSEIRSAWPPRGAACDGRTASALTCPCRAEITIDLPVPASWPTKRQVAALRAAIRPTSRPDADNYVKAGLDAICEIVVTDDALVVELVAIKRYAAVPQLAIVVTPLAALTAQRTQSFAATSGKGEAAAFRRQNEGA